MVKRWHLGWTPGQNVRLEQRLFTIIGKEWRVGYIRKKTSLFVSQIHHAHSFSKSKKIQLKLALNTNQSIKQSINRNRKKGLKRAKKRDTLQTRLLLWTMGGLSVL